MGLAQYAANARIYGQKPVTSRILCLPRFAGPPIVDGPPRLTLHREKRGTGTVRRVLSQLYRDTSTEPVPVFSLLFSL